MCVTEWIDIIKATYFRGKHLDFKWETCFTSGHNDQNIPN